MSETPNIFDLDESLPAKEIIVNLDQPVAADDPSKKDDPSQKQIAQSVQEKSDTEKTFEALKANLISQRDVLQRQLEEAQTQIQRHAADEHSSNEAILKSSIAAENERAKNAEAALAAAMQAANFSEAARQQRNLAQAEARLTQLNIGLEALETESKKQPAQRQQPTTARNGSGSDPIEDHISRFSPETQEWLRRHKDDIYAKESRGRRAHAAHVEAIEQGIKPDTEEYFRYLDNAMGYQDNSQQETTTQKRTPAAPPARGQATGGGKTQKVTLTPEERRIARNMEVSEEDYAKSKLEIQEGHASVKFR